MFIGFIDLLCFGVSGVLGGSEEQRFKDLKRLHTLAHISRRYNI